MSSRFPFFQEACMLFSIV